MSKVGELAGNTASSVKTDPIGAVKVIFVLLLVVVLIYVAYKFMSGLGRVGDLVAEVGPSTEPERKATIEKTSYSDSLKWLGDTIGAITIGKTKKYKNATDYLSKKNLTWETVDSAADAIWKAKIPAYIDDVAVYNAFSAMPTKAAISLMALSFDTKYGKLWNGGKLAVWLPKYLKLTEMDTLTDIIDKKPEV